MCFTTMAVLRVLAVADMEDVVWFLGYGAPEGHARKDKPFDGKGYFA